MWCFVHFSHCPKVRRDGRRLEALRTSIMMASPTVMTEIVCLYLHKQTKGLVMLVIKSRDRNHGFVTGFVFFVLLLFRSPLTFTRCISSTCFEFVTFPITVVISSRDAIKWQFGTGQLNERILSVRSAPETAVAENLCALVYASFVSKQYVLQTASCQHSTNLY